MTSIPATTAVQKQISTELSERVAREAQAYADSHIDDIVRRWWKRFPHVFDNPSMKAINRLYDLEVADIKGQVVLEYGCGLGDFATWLCGQGASVIGIDISEYNVEACRRRFAVEGITPDRCHFEVMDAHALGLPNDSVDLVTGNGILHHLDLEAAFEEVDRVLKPGGKALFHEPLNGNPILKVYRAVSGFQTEDEKPLGNRELDFLRQRWGAELHFTGVLTLPVTAITSLLMPKWPDNWFSRVAAAAEGPINTLKFAQTWNRMALIIYRKPLLEK